MTARQEPADLRGVAADLLARDERRLKEAGFAVEKYAREGDPAQTLVDVAGDTRVSDLIVIGAHGNSGRRHFMLGGVAGKLAHHAPRSLLIVRDD